MTQNLPESCLAAVFTGVGLPFELRRFRLPVPGPGEALVRVRCSTICGSDLHTVQGARSAPLPSVLGHETVGIVSAVGDPAPRDLDGCEVRPGMCVTWSLCASCGECGRCRGGIPQKCETLFKYGHAECNEAGTLSGGLAEYMLLRRGTAILDVPPELPDEVVCPVNCATATVAAAFRAAGSCVGRRVLIFGAGMLGLTASAWAASHGAARVVVCDPDANRLSLSKDFGADLAVARIPESNDLREQLPPSIKSNGFDVIMELSGSPNAVESAGKLADIAGQILLVGTVMDSRLVHLDPQAMVRGLLTMRGVHNYAPQDLRTALAFLADFESQFPFRDLVEHTFSLKDVNKALQTAIESRPVRVAIRP